MGQLVSWMLTADHLAHKACLNSRTAHDRSTVVAFDFCPFTLAPFVLCGVKTISCQLCNANIMRQIIFSPTCPCRGRPYLRYKYGRQNDNCLLALYLEFKGHKVRYGLHNI